MTARGVLLGLLFLALTAWGGWMTRGALHMASEAGLWQARAEWIAEIACADLADAGRSPEYCDPVVRAWLWP